MISSVISSDMPMVSAKYLFFVQISLSQSQELDRPAVPTELESCSYQTASHGTGGIPYFCSAGYLQWSTLENLKQSVQNLREIFNHGIQRFIQTTRSVLEIACSRRTEDSAMVAPEVAKPELAIAELHGPRDRLMTCVP